METLKRRLNKLLTPRPHTDLQSEVLNLIAGPIFIYTITTVFYYSLFDIMPYHYGNGNEHSNSGSETTSTSLIFHRSLLTMIYFQMMSNWLCIRLVDNSLQTSLNRLNLVTKHNEGRHLTSVEVCHDHTTRNYNGAPNAAMDHTIPGPEPAQHIYSARGKSYWSWTFCKKCNLNAPPRCHHCPMCSTCVLKRDHHCFFTGRCVGFYNQRHFIIFLVWASFGTSYSTLHFLPYLFQVTIPNLPSVLDCFPPFALLRCVFGSGSWTTPNLLFSFLFNALFILLSTGFIFDQYELVKTGITQFEKKNLNKNKLYIVDPRHLGDKIRTVMGHNYALCLVFPLAHWLFQPHENPFEWPEHKVYSANVQ